MTKNLQSHLSRSNLCPLSSTVPNSLPVFISSLFTPKHVFIAHTTIREMTQQKHKLALRSVYCCSNTRQINSSTVFRSSHASRNRKEVPRMLQGLQAYDLIWGHGGWWAEDRVGGCSDAHGDCDSYVWLVNQVSAVQATICFVSSSGRVEKMKLFGVWRSQLAVRQKVRTAPPSVRLLGSGLSASIIYQANDVWHGACTTGESDLTDWSWCYTWLESVSDHRDFRSNPDHIHMLPCPSLNVQRCAKFLQNNVKRKKREISKDFLLM